jgi:hypothetical protein
MAKDYVSKEIFNNTISGLEQKIVDKEAKIEKLEKAQNKVAWLIISAVLIALISMVVIPKVL